MIIALVSNKGGVGKTTLSMNIASGLNASNPTAVLDVDPQQSSTHWKRVGTLSGFSLPSVVTLEVQSIQAELEKMREQSTHIVVDCPPSFHAEETLDTLRLADIALIPVQPSPMDLWATVHIAGVIKEASKENPKLRGAMLINQLEAGTTLSEVVKSAVN